MLEHLFIYQLIGVALAGSFVGELQRTVRSPSPSFLGFLAAFLAGSFIAFWAAYSFYLWRESRPWAYAVAGVLGYQDEEHAMRLIKTIMQTIVNGRGGM